MSSKKLDAVRRRESWPLTAGETARLATALTIGGVQAGRGKSTGRASNAVERVWADAERRLQIEAEAEERVTNARRDSKLRDRAERRAKRGWF